MIFQIRILRFIKQLKIKQFIKPRTLMLITCVLSFNQIVAQKIIFEEHFEEATLRFDYHHAGTDTSEVIYPEEYIKEKYWSGSKMHLISPFDFGKYKVVVKDAETKATIYSNGYSTLFMEWQTTPEAKKKRRSYYESVNVPFPKNKVILEIKSIDKSQKWTTIYSEEIDPADYFIKKERENKYKVEEIQVNKSPNKALDILFIPEGYTENEMGKFIADVTRLKSSLFKVRPFNKFKKSINIRAVLAPSEESGTDIPGHGIWKKTTLNTNFYTFNSERYLTTKDIKSIKDIAGVSYYDQIYILVNTEKYGGGAIYNFYNLCTSDNKFTEEVFSHEFGHGLAWLADEYYYDDDMSSFYDKTLEPREENITTLVNFDKKWKHKLPKKLKIPTEISLKNKNNLGVYEGAGYTSKGVYRAFQECKMKSNSTKEFCEVCEETIVKVLNYYKE